MYKKEKEVFFNKKENIKESQKEYLKSIIGDINPYNSEIPILIEQQLLNNMINNSKDIFKQLQNKKIKYDKTNKNLIGNINKNPHFFTIDFALIKENDKYLPKLIELQAFPSILSSCFFYLDYYNKYNLLPDFKVNDKSEKKILELYKKTILGKEKKKHVIMLDYKQNTSSTHFDFQFTEKLLGIKSVCIENIISIDNELFYIRKNKLTKIKRIYNRIILENIPDKKKYKFINLFKNKKIHWVGHPDWYYHVSKNVLESLEGESILKCYSLDNIKNKEIFNQEFVIKPKFDYGGNNVFFNPILKDIENIKNKSDFIIQEKINYERIIHSFNRKLYTEFRLLFIFNEEKNDIEFCFSLGRLSDHKKINMKEIENNKDLGASLVFFKK